MKESEKEKIESIVSQLTKDITEARYLISIWETSNNNKNIGSALNNTKAVHIYNIHQNTILRQIAISLFKVFDSKSNKRDKSSLINLYSEINKNQVNIIDYYANDAKSWGGESKTKDILENFVSAVPDQNSDYHKYEIKIKDFRNNLVAHSIIDEQLLENSSLTLDELYEILYYAQELINDLSLAIQGLEPDIMGLANQYKKATEQFNEFLIESAKAYKRNMRKNPDEKEKKDSIEHIVYEIETLVFCNNCLQKQNIFLNPDLKNPLIESSLIHIRNIHSFLYRAPKADDVSHQDLALNKLTFANKDEIEKYIFKMNKSLNHLTYERTKKEFKKITIEEILDVTNLLIDDLKTFYSNLPNEYKDTGFKRLFKDV